MPSPLPGMDPWLEGRLWPDVHNSLIYTIRSALSTELPEGYFAGIEEYVWLSSDGHESRSQRVKPDGYVVETQSSLPQSQRGHAHIRTAEPTAIVTLPMPDAVARKQYLRITDHDGDVVTVIEVLSPSDKLPKQDRAHYLNKRDEYFAAGANLIEIDLLRKGHRVPMGDPALPEADYYILVSPENQFPHSMAWAFTVRDPIPTIPVPLRVGIPAIPLALQRCLDRAYDDARYNTKIDYTKPPSPPLRKADADWVQEYLRKHAKKRK